jgi:hypothetical protein
MKNTFCVVTCSLCIFPRKSGNKISQLIKCIHKFKNWYVCLFVYILINLVAACVLWYHVLSRCFVMSWSSYLTVTPSAWHRANWKLLQFVLIDWNYSTYIWKFM